MGSGQADSAEWLSPLVSHVGDRKAGSEGAKRADRHARRASSRPPAPRARPSSSVPRPPLTRPSLRRQTRVADARRRSRRPPRAVPPSRASAAHPAILAPQASEAAAARRFLRRRLPRPSLIRPSLRRRLEWPKPADRAAASGGLTPQPSANAEQFKVERGRAWVNSQKRLQICQSNTPHARHVNASVTDTTRPRAGPCAWRLGS